MFSCPVQRITLGSRSKALRKRPFRKASTEDRKPALCRHSFAGYAKATSIGSRPAADHVEQATHDALAIGPQAVVGVLVGNPGPQPTNATGRLLGK